MMGICTRMHKDIFANIKEVNIHLIAKGLFVNNGYVIVL